MHPRCTRAQDKLAIVGGGLAGLAAAVAAVEQGLHVELYEQAKHLGGRAGSFRDPATRQWLDYCPHVSLGCCTNLAELCRRTGVADRFQRYRTLHFFGPEGRRHDFSASRWLPAPLHLLPGLMRLGFLTHRERWSIARTMMRLARQAVSPDSGETIGQWLRREGQSGQAIERFWSVVLVSALGETVDRASLAAARKVFLDGFLASRRAYEVEIAKIPLGEIWQSVGKWLHERGAVLHLGKHVDRISGDACRATELVLRDGTRPDFDFVIAAVPWRHIGGMLDASLLQALPMLGRVREIEPAPITAVHLWFDRPITPLPHAALVGRLSQWVFNVECMSRGAETEARRVPRDPHHYAVVISASRNLANRDRRQVLAEVRDDLEAMWPAAREAELVHSRTLTHPAAVFSVLPGLDRLRPAQQTPVENYFLAGDWTATGWPATMEGAVRSGFLAMEAVLNAMGQRQPLLVSDLPRAWLTRPLAPIRATN